VSQKSKPFVFDNYFANCGPIFKIISSADSKKNSPCTYDQDFHLICNMNVATLQMKFKNWNCYWF